MKKYPKHTCFFATTEYLYVYVEQSIIFDISFCHVLRNYAQTMRYVWLLRTMYNTYYALP